MKRVLKNIYHPITIRIIPSIQLLIQIKIPIKMEIKVSQLAKVIL